METDSPKCLFMPGLPGVRKEYKFLKNLQLAGIGLEWLTYCGTYERMDQAVFTFEQCIKDTTRALEELENTGQPYFVIAYSFSTYVIRYIDFSQFPGCIAILLFSPILSLDKEDIKQDFDDLLKFLQKTGDIAVGTDSCNIPVASNDEKIQSLYEWCKSQEKNFLPTFIFVGENDETGLGTELTSLLDGELKAPGSSVRVFREPLATHKLDSYYQTSARAFLWAIVCISYLKKALNHRHHYYLWGSLINSCEWTHFSDIDVLIIGNVDNDEYATIAKLSADLEMVGGVHFGISLNNPKDLERTEFIRRNRGAIFLHELKHEAVSFGEPIAIREVGSGELKVDALMVNRILRAQIAKDLLAYHKDSSIAKGIIKSFIQAVRLTGYSRGQFIATYDTTQYPQQVSELLLYAIASKTNNYAKVSFDKLCEISDVMDTLVTNQENNSA